jgi:type II secretory pathway pseudopilin PulG
MKLSRSTRGFKLIELVFTTAIIGVLGLVIYALLNTNMVLGAKNTATNTAHQQARVAMLQMVQDLRSAVSLPALAGANGVAYPSPAPIAAEGISFQQLASGPHKITQNAAAGQNVITIAVTTPAGQQPPNVLVGQRVIVPTHQIEGDIAAVNGASPNLQLTLTNISGPSVSPPVTYPVNTLPLAINGTGSNAGDVVCLITDRCYYAISNNRLNWSRQGVRVMSNDVTNNTPFSTPLTPAGALYYRFVAAIDLSTSDLSYNNRGFKSANVLLNGQVPMRARLTTFQ